MKPRHFQITFLIALLFAVLGCEERQHKAAQLVAQSIQNYYPDNLNHKNISFDFRDISYTVSRYPERFIYTRSFQDSTRYIKDFLVNSQNFARTEDGDTIDVSLEWSKKYSASINSVLYFFQLPYVLEDPAAKKVLLDDVTINGKTYYSVKVTFEKDQGGEDYDDQYIYWINKESLAIDYFAYNYTEDEGGVRFREAINQRRIKGLLFQDYVNYEVALNTPLETIPQLFMDGKLKELSRIINKNIEVKELH